jgi:hypothetical protein
MDNHLDGLDPAGRVRAAEALLGQAEINWRAANVAAQAAFHEFETARRLYTAARRDYTAARRTDVPVSQPRAA